VGQEVWRQDPANDHRQAAEEMKRIQSERLGRTVFWAMVGLAVVIYVVLKLFYLD
jgi:hypothetical protein